MVVCIESDVRSTNAPFRTQKQVHFYRGDNHGVFKFKREKNVREMNVCGIGPPRECDEIRRPAIEGRVDVWHETVDETVGVQIRPVD